MQDQYPILCFLSIFVSLESKSCDVDEGVCMDRYVRFGLGEAKIRGEHTVSTNFLKDFSC